MHNIFRCSHLISHYFSKTIVEKNRIVDIYLLKLFLVLFVLLLLNTPVKSNGQVGAVTSDFLGLLSDIKMK